MPDGSPVPGAAQRRPRLSVTLKIGTVFVILSLIFGLLLLVNSYLTQQLIGASSAINHAGSQRMRVYRLAFLMNQPGPKSVVFRDLVLREIEELERVLSGLRHGDARYGLGKETDPKILAAMMRIEGGWTSEIKPLLMRAVTAGPAEMAAVLEQYNLRAPSFASSWSDIVEVLEERTESRVGMLHRLQFSFLVSAAALLVVAIFLLRRMIRDPLRVLTRGAEQMALGHVPTALSLRSGDELGQLATTFESMATRIGQHIEQLEALRLTGQEITTLEAGGLEQALRRIADRAADLVRADLALLLVRHPILECWVIEAASSRIFDAVRKQVLLFEETPLTTRVFDTRAPVLVADLSEHAEKRIRFRDEFGAKSYMAVPLHGPHDLIGVLVLLQTSAVRQFTDLEVQLTQQFASYAAVAIENARLLEAAEAETHHLKDKLRDVDRKIADLTHEVKAPAGRVAEFASWIVQDYASRLDDRALRYLDWIQKEGRDLMDLAERTLDLARLAAERQVVESVDVDSVIKEVLELQARLLAARGIDITVQPNMPRFACRRIHLKQVLGNLVDNAIKYMGDQPAPAIEIGSEDGQVVYVKDNGVGMEASMADRIFQPFQRLGTVEVPGAGLGLAIVKTVIEHYGGAVHVTSKSGGGSTFYVRLPIIRSEPSPASKPSES
ncbi:MAG TPA: ATP-binding protein [Nitrospiraceae bacterium]|jgi:signal transduction histidine kinase/HAMP domain-containing protein|nr:ATP-binding protein [Nitrospiraceae bacterium]